MTTILVTAGPTREHLDDVRFLTNASSGRMGFAIAEAAVRAGCRVVLVAGPTGLAAPDAVELVPVVSAQQLHDAAVHEWQRADIAFGVAAVADYRPARRAPGKPPKGADRVQLELVRNPDVIAALGATKGDRVVVGFALEALSGPRGRAAAVARARDKLARKHLDLIVLNDSGALAADDSEVALLTGTAEEWLPRQSKASTARALVERALALWRERHTDEETT